jgi:hypothetical protein
MAKWGALVVEKLVIDGVLFRLQHRIKRGKLSRHPYWYALAPRQGGVFMSVYVGRDRPTVETLRKVRSHVPRPMSAEPPPGRQCPECREPLARTVASTTGEIVVTCPLCGQRWVETAPRGGPKKKKAPPRNLR